MALPSTRRSVPEASVMPALVSARPASVSALPASRRSAPLACSFESTPAAILPIASTDSGPPASSLPSMAASPAALMVSACSDAIAPAVVKLPCVRKPMAPPAWAVASLPMDRSPTEVRFNAPVVALALPSSASLPPASAVRSPLLRRLP